MNLPQLLQSDPAAQADPAGLDNLRDIVMPASVSGWPLAPGWVLVAAVVSTVLAVAAFLYWRRWRAGAYRRAGLAELGRLTAESPIDLEALPALVKRVALAAYPRDRVAALSGRAWLEFLDRTGGTTRFTRAPGCRLAELAYDPRACEALDAAARDEIVAAVRRWIRGHREPERGGESC